MNNYTPNSIVQKNRMSVCVCEENGRKYILNNKSNLLLTKIKVDGVLITEGERCDYAVDADAKDIFLEEKRLIQLIKQRKDFDYIIRNVVYEENI